MLKQTNVCYNVIGGGNMKIISIKKVSSAKYKLTLVNGDTLTLNDQVIIDNNLLFRKDISESEKTKIIHENEYYNVYNKVLKYIMTKLRSRGEIITYLLKYELSNHERELILEKLEHLNFINDLKYARCFVLDKLNFTNDGPNKIKRSLEDAKVDLKYINEALELIKLDELEHNVVKYIEKKKRNNHRYSNLMLKNKLMIDLIQLGYDRDFIVEVLNKVTFPPNGIINNEYMKIEHQLSKKYSGKELMYKIREKLYKAGFTSDEINDFLANKNS